MRRSGYTDDYGDDDPLALGRWRQAVKRSIEGRRGQALLRELLAGLNCALQALTFVRYVVGKPQIYTGSEVMTQRHESAITEISALIAKHKEASHG